MNFKINTSRLYIATVYRVVASKIFEDEKYINLHSQGMPVRKTVVYDTGYGDYYDLITEKRLSVGLQYVPVGSEYIKPKSFVSYNEYLNNQKENLSKRKIKKLYMENKKEANK